MKKAIQIHEGDNVAVALSPLEAGEQALDIVLLESVPAGHKFALSPIASGDAVVKYGLPIGFAAEAIAPGAWVHTHNVKTGLNENACYTYAPSQPELPPQTPRPFRGYLREDGRAGIRNELWIIPTVGCVNDVCKALEMENAHLAAQYGLDGVFHFSHPYGCSQMGDDHAQTRELLAALCRHPNAGGVLVVGLGCENNKMEDFRVLFGPEHQNKMRFMVCQEEADELALGGSLLAELARHASSFRREPLPPSKLVVGMKCGGSDGLSGITANPRWALPTSSSPWAGPPSSRRCRRCSGGKPVVQPLRGRGHLPQGRGDGGGLQGVLHGPRPGGVRKPSRATRRGHHHLGGQAWAACKRAAPPRWWTCWPMAGSSAFGAQPALRPGERPGFRHGPHRQRSPA